MEGPAPIPEPKKAPARIRKSAPATSEAIISPIPRPLVPVIGPTNKSSDLMPKIASLTSDIRTLVFNLFVLLLVGLLAPVVLSQFWRNEVVVEAITVPAQLQTMGLTPEVASARLVDALREVEHAGGSAIEAIDVVASTDRVDFSIPDSGLSVDSLVYYVRRFFNISETRIGGEFRCADPDCATPGVSLRLRVFSGQSHVLQIREVGNSTESQYFYDAALRVMEEYRPIVALAAILDDQPVRAEVMARSIIRSRAAEAHWAHNLLGILKNNANQPKLAIGEFEAALVLVPDFLPAKANLANTLLAEGDAQRARTLFEEIQRADPNNVRAAEGLADLASADGQLDQAVVLYRRATELDPSAPRYLIKAALMRLGAGDEPGGVALLEEALQINPTDPAALGQLGLLNFMKSDYAAAVPYYRNAADFEPTDAGLQYQLGLSMLMSDDYEGAVERFDITVTLDPGNVDYRRSLAEALDKLGRYGEAQTVLAEVAAMAPDDPSLIYQQAMNFQHLGRNADAIAAYKRVVELDPDSMDAIIAQRFIELLEQGDTLDNQASSSDGAL
ncbi:MAG: tetratricopeptide repeat protein [Kaiparowitsia implicata GSE-PSE-MK54-09C]|jgi:tetratricopeptide (TPR) repeat protein|nr:tetratricopeptide repeat protein [Kaiparowitsia implicata GSE-PSE-MK54-09C]